MVMTCQPQLINPPPPGSGLYHLETRVDFLDYSDYLYAVYLYCLPVNLHCLHVFNTPLCMALSPLGEGSQDLLGDVPPHVLLVHPPCLEQVSLVAWWQD